MSSSRVREFRAAQNSSWAGDESAKELFYVWQEIAKRVNQAAQLQEPYLEVNILSPEENEHNVKVSNETIILRQMVRNWTIYWVFF